MPFAVVVTFTLHPDHIADFMAPMLANSHAAVRDEPGCRQFDVATDPDRPGDVFLYEVYDDAAAFAAHKTTPHYAAFDAATGPMIAAKDVRTYATVDR